MATLMSDILDSVLSIEKLKDEETGYMHVTTNLFLQFLISLNKIYIINHSLFNYLM